MMTNKAAGQAVYPGDKASLGTWNGFRTDSYSRLRSQFPSSHCRALPSLTSNSTTKRMEHYLEPNRVEPLLKMRAEFPKGHQQTLTRSPLSLKTLSMRPNKMAVEALCIAALLITLTEHGLAQIWYSTTAATDNWVSVACSADGTNLVAAAAAAPGFSGPICTSRDSGRTWTTYAVPYEPWIAVASSADGNVLAAASDWLVGSIYYSSDAGSTWNNVGSGPWTCVACSANGQVLLGGTYGSSLLVSTNAGATWTWAGATGYWAGVACSADGRDLAAVGGFDHQSVYISRDFGTTWAVATNAPSLPWGCLASSTDGTELVAGAGNSL